MARFSPLIIKKPILNVLSDAPAAAAYGLRRLNYAFTDSPIRVRRSSDNAEMDIGFANGQLDIRTLTSFVGSENLLTYSEELDKAPWFTVNANVTLNQIEAPDRTVTAEYIKETNVTAYFQIAQGFTVVSGTSYTFSVYAKAGERQYLTVNSNGAYFSINDYATYDLINGNVSQVGTSGTASIQNVGNGWFRCTRTLPAIASGGANVYWGISTTANGGRAPSYAGDSTKGLYLWGAQVNTGSTAKAYNKTVGGIGGNGYVTTWYDQSGNGNNAIQTTASAQPVIVNSGNLVTTSAGKPAMQFTASSSTFLQTTNTMVNDSSLRAFMHLENIAKPSTGDGNFYRSVTGGGVFYLNSGNSQKYALYNGTVLNSSYVGDGDTGGIFSVFQGTSGQIYRNGVLIASGDSGTSSITNKMNIGCGNGLNYITLKTGEYIFYNNAAMTDTQRQSIERNQGKFYGISIA